MYTYASYKYGIIIFLVPGFVLLCKIGDWFYNAWSAYNNAYYLHDNVLYYKMTICTITPPPNRPRGGEGINAAL